MEYLHIHSGKSITANLKVVNYTDKDTNHIIFFCPSLDVTGYGETKEQAEEVFKFSLTEVFKHLVDLSHKQLEDELRKCGWKKDRIKNKEYSKTYVDVSGELKEFSLGEIETNELVYG